MSLLDPTLPFASSSKQRADDEYGEAFGRWKADQSPGNNAMLLQTVRPVLDTAVSSYGGGSGSAASPNLKSKAKLMAIKAFGSYDPQKGSLKTHLLSQLRGLQRTAGDERQIISVPERVMLERNTLLQTENELEAKLGRQPSDVELANHTGLSRKRLAYIRRAHAPINTGSVLDAQGEDWGPASTLPGDSSREDAWIDFVYHDLDDVNRNILDMTLGRNGRPRMSNDAIARRLRLSPGAISQRKAKIQTMLQELNSNTIM